MLLKYYEYRYAQEDRQRQKEFIKIEDYNDKK